MLNLDQHSSLGAALQAALERWPGEVCLIESDREKEKTRLTYSDFKEMALPLARALEDADLRPGDRAAIIMTNQSKWLISAYAVFYRGGVLVPLDFKLSAAEHLQLLAHSQARFLIIEYYLWRAILESPESRNRKIRSVLVTEAPPGADLGGALRWEDFRRKGDPDFVPRQREDVACIVYSSGTGGRPKGCVLTHDNYLEQCKSLTAWYPFAPGVRYLSILPTNHAIDFMVGFIGPFVCGACVVHLRTLRPEFVRDAFVRHKITYVSLVPMVLKNLERGLKAKFEELPSVKRFLLDRAVGVNRALTQGQPRLKLSRGLLGQVHHAFGGDLEAIFTGGAFVDPSTLQFFYDLGIPVANGYGLTEACTVLTLNDLKPFRADTVGKPLPGVELRILNPEADGIGEVAVRSKTVMAHYLDDPELTAETHRGWLAADRRPRKIRWRRPSAVVWAQEEHDRDRRRKKHLSGGHRERLRRVAGQGVLHFCRELPVADQKPGAGDVGARGSARSQPGTDRRLAGSDDRGQPAPARLQAGGRISAMERGFSADRIHENQAPGAGRRNRQKQQPRGCGSAVKQAYLAVVNPAAGGGRCRKLVGPALERLRAAGIELEVAETRAPGEGTELARTAYRRGYRKFIAVGGDGTSYEIVNGLFPQAEGDETPTLAFLPLGTGNSFLREFSDRGVAYAMEALVAGRTLPCDVLRLVHQDGVIYYINLPSMGFAADVATLRARRFSRWGELGYQIVHLHYLGVVPAAAVSAAGGRRKGDRPPPLSVSQL